jgi:hypothetical protein
MRYRTTFDIGLSLRLRDTGYGDYVLYPSPSLIFNDKRAGTAGTCLAAEYFDTITDKERLELVRDVLGVLFGGEIFHPLSIPSLTFIRTLAGVDTVSLLLNPSAQYSLYIFRRRLLQS